MNILTNTRQQGLITSDTGEHNGGVTEIRGIQSSFN
jgi:hypothetical protein